MFFFPIVSSAFPVFLIRMFLVFSEYFLCWFNMIQCRKQRQVSKKHTSFASPPSCPSVTQALSASARVAGGAPSSFSQEKEVELLNRLILIKLLLDSNRSNGLTLLKWLQSPPKRPMCPTGPDWDLLSVGALFSPTMAFSKGHSNTEVLLCDYVILHYFTYTL